MSSIQAGCLSAVLLCTAIGAAAPLEAAQFDETMAWPLCGRIAEAPSTWQAGANCPSNRWGNSDHSDLPIRSTFGPRWLASDNNRYDFHRGIDIATAKGSPVFAIADGVVRKAGTDPAYSGPLVQIRHFRPEHNSCETVGCYHSNYLHLQKATVKKDETVIKGQLIGYSGASASGFEHLHFEIRDAPAADIYSNWSRDAIHPLKVLAMADDQPLLVKIGRVDGAGGETPEVEVTVTSKRPDINRVELTLYNEEGAVIAQSGNQVDEYGYNVNPSWFDMILWNRQYTHKDSNNVPWDSFDYGGEYQCPYALAHGADYNAHVHMDRAWLANYQVGFFNGLRIATKSYSSGDYYLKLIFEELRGSATCIVATATSLKGKSATTTWGECADIGGGGKGKPEKGDGSGGGKDKKK